MSNAPRELLMPCPREVRVTGYGWLMILFSFALMAAGAGGGQAFTKAYLSQRDELEQFRNHAVDAEATVTRLWRTGGQRQTDMMDYRFEAAGQTYSGSSPVPGADAFGLKAGSKVPVRYVASDPSRNHPGHRYVAPQPLWLGGLVGGLFILVGIGLCVTVRRQANLLRDGALAQATVKSHDWGGSGRAGGRRQVACYEFSAMDGSVITGMTQPSSQPPAIGSSVYLIYDPANPRRQLTYPAMTARIVEPPAVTG